MFGSNEKLKIIDVQGLPTFIKNYCYNFINYFNFFFLYWEESQE